MRVTLSLPGKPFGSSALGSVLSFRREATWDWSSFSNCDPRVWWGFFCRKRRRKPQQKWQSNLIHHEINRVGNSRFKVSWRKVGQHCLLQEEFGHQWCAEKMASHKNDNLWENKIAGGFPGAALGSKWKKRGGKVISNSCLKKEACKEHLNYINKGLLSKLD